jgi:hypothetical protein
MWVILRIAIGCLFLVSGLGKLLSPYQNFLYVIQAYQVLPSWGEVATARIFPWLELITGVFVFLGFWMPWCLRGACVLFGIFLAVVGQALVRGLPLDNCGCFGEWVHLKPQMVFVMDCISLSLTLTMLRHLSGVKQFSLDSYFEGI